MTDDTQQEGIVYVLTNESMPDLVKIGITRNMKQRLRDLYTTNVPLPFELHYAVRVNNANEVEQRIHAIFAPDRVTKRREFFEISAERVVEALLLTNGTPVDEDHVIGDGQSDPADTNEQTEITDDDRKASQRRTQRRSSFSFKEAKIEEGSKLEFSRDSEIIAEVVNDRTILYNGEHCSLSDAAGRILVDRYGYKSKAVAGTEFWEYQGELLSERRKRLERERYEGGGTE